MNTERVKNILIVFLSIITLGLAYMIFIEENRHTLSAAQESAIVAILERNDIQFSAEMVTSTRPMRQMQLEWYDYNISDLVTRFFGEATADGNLRIEYVFDGVIFETDCRAMSFSTMNNTIVFEIPDGVTNDDFDAASGAVAARALAEWYVRELLTPPDSMIFFRQEFNHNWDYVFSFFSTYRGNILYNDHIRVTVADRGITHILYSRVYNPMLTGDALAVISPDEALLALLNHLRHVMQIEGRIVIGDMYIAYFLTHQQGQTIAVPAYVFTIALGANLELRFNHIICAHSNRHIWHEIIR